jgi:SAM-dependent MidA family methyltransferase
MKDNPGVRTPMATEQQSLTSPLLARVRGAIADAGGWLPFDRLMAIALYEPGLGYYANALAKFGQMPQSGSDFVTAPELTPLFGQALARQVAQALAATGTDEVWEFGAGTGALALQVIEALALQGQPLRRYTIVDLSGSLRERQRATLAAYVGMLHWADALPERMQGVVLGNEVLDAMPVQLLARVNGAWHERGVALDAEGILTWVDRATALRPPLEVPGEHDYVTEIHPQAEAFVRTLADRLHQGAAFLLDYGFPEAEYYHPQRAMGTLICHPRAPQRRRPAERSRREGHHRAREFQRHRVGRAGRRHGRAGLHQPGPLPAELQAARPRAARRRAAERDDAETAQRARNGRAVQGHRARAGGQRRGLGAAGFHRGATARTGSESQALTMIRWMIVIFLALLLISWFTPLLRKLGFGKLPGDFHFKAFGREWFLPFATTILLSLVASLIGYLI